MSLIVNSVYFMKHVKNCGWEAILDAALITNELINKLKFRKRDEVLCKLDMEKVYDYRCWVRTRITTTSFALIINGGASTFFQASKELRQGDPLLLLLLIVVMEVLNNMIIELGSVSYSEA
ncbi:uncharacterized protein LOC110808156 [Carica papaya]|uniref:uncharacterized protein LOC110808156 n=1 Tax=Carica papaya TaxID=3649 RepID=UPI000B8CA0A7|nr:uncharacterized protein LOC110808156 [Carica papaya]